METVRLLVCVSLLLSPASNSAIALESVEPQLGQAKPASSQESQTAKPPAKALVGFGLEDGTPIKLRLTRTITSEDTKVNDRLDFEIVEEVKIGEVVVIPRGGIAWATVTEAQPKRRMGRGGKLSINIEDVRLVSGEKAPLRAVKEARGGGHVGAMTTAIVVSGILFFPVAPLFLFMHGKSITIPKGTEITAYVNGDIILDAAKFAPKPASEGKTETVPAPQTVPGMDTASPSTVLIKSTPDGAKITVEGKFMGNTPSTLRLAAGEFKIRIEKAGFKPWERAMSMNAGASVTIEAVLEKVP